MTSSESLSNNMWMVLKTCFKVVIAHHGVSGIGIEQKNKYSGGGAHHESVNSPPETKVDVRSSSVLTVVRPCVSGHAWAAQDFLLGGGGQWAGHGGRYLPWRALDECMNDNWGGGQGQSTGCSCPLLAPPKYPTGTVQEECLALSL